MKSLYTALTTIRRSPYQALNAISILTLTCFIGYVFSLFVIGSNIVIKHFEAQPQVIAFFKLETIKEDITKVEYELKQKSYVKETKVIDQEQALKFYQEENKDQPLLLELVTADILPASIEVSGQNISDLIKIRDDLKKFDSVEDIALREDVVSKIANWIQFAKVAGFIAFAILAGISFISVVSFITLKVNNQKKSITIMRIIGATKWYIQKPFVLEGMIYGFIGALIGWTLMFALLLYSMPFLSTHFAEVKIFPVPLWFYFAHAVAGVTLSLTLTAIASSIAVRRFIKW